MENTIEPTIVLSPEECLATIIELKLTKKQYNQMRKKQKKCNAKMFVSWHKIIEVKKKCEPPDIDSSKTGEVKVPLQSVVSHQASNIMGLPDVKEKHQKILDSGKDHELTCFGKYLKLPCFGKYLNLF